MPNSNLAAKVATITTPEPPKADKSTFVYVEIPEMDMLGGRHCGVWLNGTHYKPGKHFVAPDIHAEITRILKVKDNADLRVIQPNKDLNALAQLAKRLPANTNMES